MFINVNGVKQDQDNDATKSFNVPVVTSIVTFMDKNQTKKVIEVYNEAYVKGTFDYDILNDEKVVDTHRIAAIEFGSKIIGRQFRGNYHINLTDDDVSRSLKYLFKKSSDEVKKFNKAELVKKVSIEKNGLLYSKSRILDIQRFKLAGGLEDKDIIGKGHFGLSVVTPVLDRYSPLSYSIGDYVHRIISKHGGYETCLRDSLNHVYIMQGMSLFREIGEDCVKCLKKRKKFLDISMGPIADEQLYVAPAFWITMCDIFGPCQIYVPGHSMVSRTKKAITVQCYVLVFVCPTTKAINLQVIETKAANGIVDGVTRLSCEVGVPNYLLVD